MTHLFSSEGDQAIEEIAARSPLLALDFDGTLAPIVALPDQARATVAISQTLSQVVDFLPIAIITGRSVADVSNRLGFVPRYIVGNHGVEGLPDSGRTQAIQTVTAWRESMQRTFGSKLEAAGVLVEDKGYSMSLHYRIARDQALAQQAIQSTIAGLAPKPRVIGGKCVTNLLPPDAPDKFHAVVTLARIARCGTVIFAGDDETDDVVFEQAPSTWLTIRIEPRDNHQARFHLKHQNEVAIFLQRLLRSLERHRQRQDLAGKETEGLR